MINFDFEKNCYGCRNCENVCPKQAIEIKENREGFLMPEIDKNKCINCGLCDKKCPYLTYKEKNDIRKNVWYSAFLKDVAQREKSTSGGIFPALADYVISKNGLVCGCVWDENMKPIHILTNNPQDILRMSGSKYMQSDLRDVVKEIKNKINTQIILFTGTPCQVAAVKNIIGEHENLYTIGLICEGVGPYKVWNLYKDFLEKQKKSKMINASFRNKEIGWDSPVARYEFESNKKIKVLSFEYDMYVRGFLQALYYRKSCNNCQYKGNGHNSDILIGDLWGASKEQLKETNYKGISAVILNTEKGKSIFELVQNKFEFASISPEKVIEHNKLLMKPKEENKNRKNFYNNLETTNIVKNIKQNTKNNKIKRILKEILYKFKVFRIIKKVRLGGK